MDNCIFCMIVNKEIPSKVVYEDDNFLGFEDINPVAPIHVIFIPKKHINSLDTAGKDDFKLFGEMLQIINEYAKKNGFSDDGYRVNINTNKNGGQDVYHIHFHLIAGRQMMWPPG